MRKNVLSGAIAAAFLTACPSYGNPKADAADQADFLTVTCGEYLQTARMADPGQKPSRVRREQSAQAQDSLVDTMLWLHGYQSGRSAAAPAPLNRAWIVEHVGALARACRARSPDGSLRLVDVASQL